MRYNHQLYSWEIDCRCLGVAGFTSLGSSDFHFVKMMCLRTVVNANL